MQHFTGVRFIHSGCPCRFSPDYSSYIDLAILRGAVFNDGRAILPYREDLINVLILLRDRARSKRGYAWAGKLLYSILTSCTHTYSLENHMVNQDEWQSAGMSDFLGGKLLESG